MKQTKIKERLDNDLEKIIFDESLKDQIRKQEVYRKPVYKSPFKYAVAACLFVLVLSTTVFAAYTINNVTKVNETVLPGLDPMDVVHITFPKNLKEENGLYFSNFTDINNFCETTGLHLLKSEFAEDNPYMIGYFETDKESTATIRVKNYIIGDTSNYHYIADEEFYSYTSGEVYKTPITLQAIIILSEEQLKQGLDSEYLGYYEYVESYISSKGYKVNLIQSTIDDDIDASNIVSEKCAIFVADGVQYTLSGRVSTEEMKKIVNSFIDAN